MFLSGLHYHYGHRRWKYYTEQDIPSAKFVMDVKLAPDLNSHLEDDLLSICVVVCSITIIIYLSAMNTHYDCSCVLML